MDKLKFTKSKVKIYIRPITIGVTFKTYNGTYYIYENG